MWTLPQVIQLIAHALSGIRFNSDFQEWFVPAYSRGRGILNLTDNTLKAAESLLNLFRKVYEGLSQTVKLPENQSKHQVGEENEGVVNGPLKIVSLRISHNQIMHPKVSDFTFFSHSLSDCLKLFKITVICLSNGFQNASLRFDHSPPLNG